MICPPGIGCPFTDGFGIASILLWVLTFAITFAVLKKTALGKRTGALVSIVVAFLVLMAVPTAVMQFVASMSTGLVVLAIGALVLLSFFELSGTGKVIQVEDGTVVVSSLTAKYGTILTLIAIAIIIAMFVNFGGLGLIGMESLPILTLMTPGMWLLILVGIAIIWMISEEPPKPAAPQKK